MTKAKASKICNIALTVAATLGSSGCGKFSDYKGFLTTPSPMTANLEIGPYDVNGVTYVEHLEAYQRSLGGPFCIDIKREYEGKTVILKFRDWNPNFSDPRGLDELIIYNNGLIQELNPRMVFSELDRLRWIDAQSQYNEYLRLIREHNFSVQTGLDKLF